MIENTLTSKIDEMTQNNVNNNDVSVVNEPKVDDSIFSEDSVQVAGLGKIGSKIGKKVLEQVDPVVKTIQRKKPTPKEKALVEMPEQKLPADELTPNVINNNVVEKPPVKPTEAQVKIQEQINNNPTVTPEQLAAQQDKELARIQNAKIEGTQLKPGEFSFNYEVLNTTDDVSALIEANATLFNIKTKNITFDDVIKSSQEIGLSKSHIENLMSGKLEVNPELAYKTNELIKVTQNSLAVKLEKVRTGGASPNEMAEIIKEIQFSGVLLQQARQYKTNIAQSLGILRANVADVQDISQISSFKSVEEFQRFAEKYVNSSDMAKANLIDGVTKGNLFDKLNRIYVSGLVSRPATHFKNIVATTGAIPLRWANKAGAAAMDVIRVTTKAEAEREVFLSEVMSEMMATGTAFKNGVKAAQYAAKNGRSLNSLNARKIEGQNPFGDILEVKDGSPFAPAIKFFNFTASAPGKALFIGDEFLQGINYTYELEAHVTRQAMVGYKKALKETGDVSAARSMYDDIANSIYDNPPDSLHALAAENVFVKPLEPGFLNDMKNMINSSNIGGFAAKTQIPFFQTPTNLYSQTFEQIPALAMATKKARQDLASGDPARVQLALSKQAIGAGLMYTASEYAADGNITGPGPKNFKERQLLLNQGWQPFSVVVSLPNASKNFQEKYKSIFTKGTGDYEGKYFLSYEGFEPVGALLAIGASYADYARYEDDADLLNSMIYGAAPGIAEYAMSHPLLEGVNRIGEFIDTIGSATTEDQIDSALNEMISGVGVIGYKATIPLSGLQKTLREKTDEFQREYKVESQEYKLLEGVYEAQNKILNNIPFGSDALPKKINIWAEPLTYEDAWFPLRATKGKALEANEILINTNTQFSAPTNRYQFTAPDGVSVSIKLEPQEYQHMIEIANFDLNLQDKIIQSWDLAKEELELAAQAGTPIQKQKLQKAFLDIMNNTFNDAKKQLVIDSIYSDKIQQRIFEEIEQIRDDVVE
jgi:hypothetical protein